MGSVFGYSSQRLDWIPELAKGLGQGIKEFKGGMKDVKQEIEDATKEDDSNSDSAKEKKSSTD